MNRIVLRTDLKLNGVDLARLDRFLEVWPARALAEFFRLPGTLERFTEMAKVGGISPEGTELNLGVWWRSWLSIGIAHGYSMEDICRFYAHSCRNHGEWSDSDALERGWQMLLGDALHEVVKGTWARPKRKKEGE